MRIYLILNPCRDFNVLDKLVMNVINEARKERRKLIIISLLCSELNYVEYFRKLNDVLSNVYDVSTYLYEVYSITDALNIVEKEYTTNDKIYSTMIIENSKFNYQILRVD